MKKKIILNFIFLFALAALFAACGNASHPHTPDDWIVDSRPTCTAAGSTRQVCSVCGETLKTESQEALGHTEGEWVVAAEPTVAEPGRRELRCSVCGEILQTEEIPAKGSENLKFTSRGDGTCYVSIGTCEDTDIVIPKFSPENDLVTSIGNGEIEDRYFERDTWEHIDRYSGFDRCEKITSIVIPDSVTRIATYAFRYCRALKSISIPGSVTFIGERAFFCCSALESVILPEGVERIAYNAFGRCSKLKSVSIPESVVSIEGSVFDICPDLEFHMDRENYYLGNENNPYYALIRAKNAPSCIIHPDTKVIAGYAFSGYIDAAALLTSIDIPDGVKSIGMCAFQDCAALTSVTIPNSVKSIEMGAFRNCTALTCLIIPDSVTGIGGYAFSGCTNLQFSVYDNADYLGNENNPYFALIKATSYDVESCSIHPDTEVIASYAFNNSYLKNIEIPDRVTHIGDQAFYRFRGLESSVTIPNSVVDIGRDAFSIINIRYEGTMAQWNEIEKDKDWNVATEGYTVHCTDGDLKVEKRKKI